eukprot:5827725-Pleurochrysis_carterae.AAC.1
MLPLRVWRGSRNSHLDWPRRLSQPLPAGRGRQLCNQGERDANRNRRPNLASRKELGSAKTPLLSSPLPGISLLADPTRPVRTVLLRSRLILASPALLYASLF